jgi:hypothetical protein
MMPRLTEREVETARLVPALRVSRVESRGRVYRDIGGVARRFLNYHHGSLRTINIVCPGLMTFNCFWPLSMSCSYQEIILKCS